MKAFELTRADVKPRGRINRMDYEDGLCLVRFSCGSVRLNGDPANGGPIRTANPRYPIFEM